MKSIFGILVLFLIIGLIAPKYKFQGWTRLVMMAVIAGMILYITVA